MHGDDSEKAPDVLIDELLEEVNLAYGSTFNFLRILDDESQNAVECLEGIGDLASKETHELITVVLKRKWKRSIGTEEIASMAAMGVEHIWKRDNMHMDEWWPSNCSDEGFRMSLRHAIIEIDKLISIMMARAKLNET